ncbi:MAG: hypothetical protein N2512_05945 [Armatimonadetes bacterium]|nr:hypothetical protein [Armatimonadota bacterium]
MYNRIAGVEVHKMPQHPLVQNLADVARVAGEKLRKRLADSEVARHLLAADRELLLAVRAVIDGKVKWIESLTQVSSPAETNGGPA